MARQLFSRNIFFHSVILVSQKNITNLPSKIEECKYNSPWNVATEYQLDITFNPQEISTMLVDYENDYHIGFRFYYSELSTADISEQTKLVMDNIGAILKAAGLSYENIVKTTCLLADINDFAAMNKVYAEYFPNNPPARSAFAVKDLPKGARLEIEVIAN